MLCTRRSSSFGRVQNFSSSYPAVAPPGRALIARGLVGPLGSQGVVAVMPGPGELLPCAFHQLECAVSFFLPRAFVVPGQHELRLLASLR